MNFASFGIGAYLGSMLSVTLVATPPLLSSFDLTLPIVIPDMRTSASLASVDASGTSTVSLYACGFSGIGPPKDNHRKMTSPKQLIAKTIIAIMRPRLGG